MEHRPDRILTIGVYGFNAGGFFDALVEAGVDVFCDIRARRGLRGSEYAFANSRRLQEKLESLSIRYEHVKELAPTSSVRDAQKKEDAQSGTAKRLREEMGETARALYRRETLTGFDSGEFLRSVVGDAKHPVLFCVERSPRACHRSLVAEELAAQTGLPVEHLSP